MKRGLILFLCLVVVIGAAAYLFSSTTQNNNQLKEPQRVAGVKRSSLLTRVSETGTLEPIRTIDIKSQFSGEVRRLLVSEGQLVSPNQPLAVIQQEPSQARQVAQLRAAIEQERINVEQAELQLERMQSLFAKGFVPRNELESAEQDTRRAAVRQELAKRELLLALGGNRELYRRYLSRDASSNQLEEFQVLSPSSGTMIEVSVQRGEIITSGTATVGGGAVLMRLADLSRMVARAKINEVNIARVRIGQSVEAWLDAIPGVVFEGTVTAISPQGEKEDSIVTYDVTIEIENREDRLRPMMTANVDILTDSLENVLTIPLESLQIEDGDDVVYVLEDEQRVRRKVQVGFRTEVEAVIVRGVSEGEAVVLPSYTDQSPKRSRR